MASIVARAAALRLGSGMLAPLPGQAGAAVLSVRRDGPGRGEVLELKIKFPRPAEWVVKATNAEYHPTEGSDSECEEFELVSELKAIMERNIAEAKSTKVLLCYYDAADLERKFFDHTLQTYAKSSFALWVDVANRIRPATDSKVYQDLKLSGHYKKSRLL